MATLSSPCIVQEKMSQQMRVSVYCDLIEKFEGKSVASILHRKKTKQTILNTVKCSHKKTKKAEGDKISEAQIVLSAVLAVHG